jgi:hypothetical protein
MLPPFEGFDWDDGNRAKCVKHGLTIEQIESVSRGRCMWFQMWHIRKPKRDTSASEKL